MVRDGKRIKKFAGRVGRTVYGSAEYLGGAAKRKIQERIEQTVGEPIGRKERQAYLRARQKARLKYYSQPKARYVKPKQHVAESMGLLGNQSIDFLGTHQQLGSKKKKQQYIPW